MIRIQFAGAGVKLVGKGLMCNEKFVDDDYVLDLVCHIRAGRLHDRYRGDNRRTDGGDF